MELIITDLDGTLLDHRTYAFDEAGPALALLKRRLAVVALCTSKTRAEVEYWRQRLDNRDPFIVENGGALFVPTGCFPGQRVGPTRRGEYDVWELGAPYGDLVEALREASREARCRVRGFCDMTSGEIAEECGMSPVQAALAKRREYDEPFLILDEGRTQHLLTAIREGGRHWTMGGRFYHITGDNDKAKAASVLIELCREAHSEVLTIGLGDGINDAAFLNVVDVPIVIRSPGLDQLMARVPRGVATRCPGPKGWNEAILGVLDRECSDCQGESYA